MFGQSTVKNRRFTPKEFEDELLVSRIWRRRPRTYLFDMPDYNIEIPEPLVNFKLNYQF